MADHPDIRAISNLLDGPITPNARKLIEKALEYDWQHNFTSLVTRWAPHGEAKYGEPFFMSWHLDLRDDKWKWRFSGGMAANLQRLKLQDAMLYLEHPEVIYPEPPRETWADQVVNTMRGNTGSISSGQ